MGPFADLVVASRPETLLEGIVSGMAGPGFFAIEIMQVEVMSTPIEC